ncbi:MAG: glycosyltransferase family protein [Polyangiaceae bacterium]|nr:glycosyltransferase family protein [Polyangiaceae bacterium]
MNQKKKVVAIVQARASSSRFPGKVLSPLAGRPMLQVEIERIQRCQFVDEVVLATSTDASDDPLEALARQLGLSLYRGSLTDVLDRFYKAAEAHQAEIVVRLTGDCPLIDPELIDACVQTLRATNLDYVSNIITPSWPHGFDAEVTTMACLRQAQEEAIEARHREHVTLFLRENAKRFKSIGLQSAIDYSSIRLTVDYPEDLEVVREIYEKVAITDPTVSRDALLAFIEDNPTCLEKNRHHDRAEVERRASAEFYEQS